MVLKKINKWAGGTRQPSHVEDSQITYAAAPYAAYLPSPWVCSVHGDFFPESIMEREKANFSVGKPDKYYVTR
jgi:hypothetical protein